MSDGKGYDPTLDRAVAIKVITPDAREEPGVITRRFRREARIAAGLNHPNVVTFYEFGKDQGVLEDELHFSEVLAGGSSAPCDQILDFVKPDAVVMVQESFAAIAERPHQTADLFYRLLFEIDPGVEPLFAGIDMATQGKKLMETLSQMVRGFDRLEEIRPAVEELGRRHAGYGVELRATSKPSSRPCSKASGKCSASAGVSTYASPGAPSTTSWRGS